MNNNKITLRSILLALILIPVNVWWIFQCEQILYTVSPTTLSIFFTSVFIVLVLVIINGFIKRISPKYTLSQVELITIYIGLNISASLIGHDFLHMLMSVLPYPVKFATAENNWFNLIINRIPDWSIVKDKETVNAFYVGGETFFQWKYIKHWLRPMIAWSGFIMILFYVMLCINTILRKQWNENEKLAYPLVSMPLEITKENTDFFKNKVLYAGIIVAIVFTLLQGMYTIVPSFPVFSLKQLDLSQYFVNPPFNAMGFTPVRAYPIAIGITFLVPADLSFSFWFFYLLTKFQYVFGASVGINTIPKYPFINEQCFGVLVGIFVFSMFMGKKHLKAVFKTMFKNKNMDDSDEPLGYKNAIWGAILGMCALMLFSKMLGTSTWIAIILIAFYFIICISLTRTRAELGSSCHEINYSNIIFILTGNIGTATIGPQNVIGINMFYWFNRCLRSNMMPIQLESFKMAERTNMSYRKLAGLLMFFAFFSLVICLLIMLQGYYKMGASNLPSNITAGLGGEVYNSMDASLRNGTIADWNGIWAVIIGFVGCIALSIAKIQIPGFPLNPVAYAMMSTYSTHLLWSSVFISWACKVSILKFGGLRTFTKALPFFLGLIIGDCIAGTFWSIVSMIIKTPTYAIFP